MMRHSFFNPASGRRLSPVPLLLLAVCGLVAFVCLSVDLCADDYFYGTFLRDGFDSFVARNVEHYQTYNGRVQVHLLLQVVLHLGIPAYALACMAMLLLIPLLGRWAAGLGRETRLTVPLFFFLLLLLVGREVLREGLFWISACFNYLYPALLVVCAAALSRLALRARLPWFLLLCPAAFLCGATTEQCGVFSALILLALPLREAVRARRLRLPALLLPLCALGGYLTILSSPATQGRIRSGMNVAALWGQLDLLGGVIFGADGLFLLILAVLGLVFLSALLRPEFPRLGLGALPCAAALILLFHIPGLEAPARWAFLLTMGYCGLLAAALFFTASPCQGVLLAAGVGEAAIMAFTDTYGSRVLLPLALSLCLTGALLAAPLLPTLPPRARGAVLCAAAALCVLVFLPTAAGYAGNARVRDFNHQQIRQAHETGVMYYSMDYDPDFCHTPIYANGFIWNNFFSYNRLSGVRFFLTAQDMYPVYANGQRTTSPGLVQDGQTYFPVEQILTALGGSALWTPTVTTFSLGDVEVLYYDGVLHAWDGEMWDTRGKAAHDFYTTCFTEDVFRECFGISITFDAQEQAYVARLAEPGTEQGAPQT